MKTILVRVIQKGRETQIMEAKGKKVLASFSGRGSGAKATSFICDRNRKLVESGDTDRPFWHEILNHEAIL